MGRSFAFFVNYPTDSESICGASMELRDGVFPVPSKDIQIEDEKLKFSISDSRLEQENGININLPEILVEAEYLADNLTNNALDVEFAFPVIQDLYGFKFSGITANGKEIPHSLVDHESFIKVICEQAELRIDQHIKRFPELGKIIELMLSSEDFEEKAVLKLKLADWVESNLNLDENNRNSLGEYYFIKSIYKTEAKNTPFYEYLRKNIYIYEAVELHTKILNMFEKNTDLNYAKIFKLWGGDQRVLSVDVDTKELRPRENSLEYLSPVSSIYGRKRSGPPTKNFKNKTWASFSILDQCAALTPYSFAPMALVKYRLNFAPSETQRIRIRYSQIMSIDTGDKKNSGQFQYLLKPAQGSRQDEKIRLIVKVPKSNKLVVYPALNFKVARDERGNIYKVVLDNYNSNIYIGVA